MRLGLALGLIAGLLVAVPLKAATSLLDYRGECAPFARLASGVQIFGDAWTWWGQAEDRYERGTRPQVGAVLVFRQSQRLRFGHVAVVSRVLTSRVVMVTHANWSRFDGERGHVERDVTMTDVSAAGDWSKVKVWYRDNDALGGSEYPVYGFIYGAAAAEEQRDARPSAELSAQDPDYIGTLIHAGY